MSLVPPVLLSVAITNPFFATLLIGLSSLPLLSSITQHNTFILNLPWLQAFIPLTFGRAGFVPFSTSLWFITSPTIIIGIISSVPCVPQVCRSRIWFSWRNLHHLSLLNPLFFLRICFTSSTIYLVSSSCIIFKIHMTSCPVIMFSLLCWRTQVQHFHG